MLHAITSDNDSTWVDSRPYNTSGGRGSEPSTTQMSLTLTTSFDDQFHDPESIDRIAFEDTHDTTNGITFDFLKSADTPACCSV
mgnify:CR=1 FL=1